MKVRESRVPVAVLREWLSYDAETGALHWRKGKKKVSVGNRAGYLAMQGHRVVKVEKSRFYAHRIAWAIHYGEWPPDDSDVDHINGNKDDNSIRNLRLASRAQNLHNQKRNSRNTSGVKGVCWNKREKKWMAQIRHNGARVTIGYYRDLGEAAKAYRAAAIRYHGQFANFG